MYRAVTLAALRAGVGSDDAAGLAALADLAATMTSDGELRSPEVERSVSLVASHPEVRAALHRAQRSFLAQGDAVAEGRDVGEVVWPEAELKVWLDAAPDVRARRRVEELGDASRGSRAGRARRARRGADDPRARRGRDRQHGSRPRRRRGPHRRARARATAMSDVPADDYRIVTPDRFWGFWRLLLQRPFTWFFRMRVYGAEHVPRTGPAVIASNHIAGIDVVVLGAASPRTLRYMAKAELFTYNRILAWMLRHAGAFGVRRGESDLEALRLARRVLQAGHALGVFCEGTRQPSEEIGDGAARRGADRALRGSADRARRDPGHHLHQAVAAAPRDGHVRAAAGRRADGAARKDLP